MQKNYKRVYKTSDLGLAAVLLTYRVPILEIDKTNPKRVLFIFPYYEGLDFYIESYLQNDMWVSPLDMMEKLRELKSRIYG